MNVLIKKSIYIVSIVTVLLIIKALFFNTDAFSEPLVPDGLVIQEKYAPGAGKTIGNIQFAQGKVIIMHADLLHGYLAKEKMPLFKGDTIIAMERGRARFRLNDGSTLTMASKTKLVINKSVYDTSGKRRSSFISMNFGKARFWVKKLVGFKEPEFKVKTKTAVIGVRGSDFVVRSTQDVTEVTTLENTLLEVVSMAAIEAPPITLSEFERITIEADAYPSPVIDVPQKEIEEMMMEMMVIIADRAEPDRELKIQKEDMGIKSGKNIVGPVDETEPAEPIEKPGPGEDKKPVAKPESDNVITSEKSEPDEPIAISETHVDEEPYHVEETEMEETEIEETEMEETEIQMPKDQLVETEAIEHHVITEFTEISIETWNEDTVQEQHTDITDQAVQESKELSALPGPPGE